jgi:predicted RNA binding protein YcfA (HicA-like mRNA interferase family)
MIKLPGVKPIQVIRKFKKGGFVFDRQAKGSHEIWLDPLYLKTIPKTINRLVFLAIGPLCATTLSVEQFPG